MNQQPQKKHNKLKNAINNHTILFTLSYDQKTINNRREEETTA
jgi:hypothetical protein